MSELPDGFRSAFVDSGTVKLHVVHNAGSINEAGRIEDERPAILFLHGFPEYWAAWKPVLSALADDYLLLAPDQRGYNLSDAPQDVPAYATGKLAGDILAVADTLLGFGRVFTLAGHDWGASVAYALAIGHGQRLNGLIIVNGVHPVIFQKALLEDAGQCAASQYFHILTASDAAGHMAENGYARTFSMFEKFSSSPWLTDEDRAGYLAAWSQPGRLNAMLNWYRGSPIVVPKPGEAKVDAPLASGTPERFGVNMPHLIVWGMADQALRPVARKGIEAFAPQLQLIEIADGDHWVIHTHGNVVADHIDQFMQQLTDGNHGGK